MAEVFVRVLFPVDPWLNTDASSDERATNFQGGYTDISVAMQERCTALRVLAAFHGSRREFVLDTPACFSFSDTEVHAANGTLVDTPAKPPWPGDYNHAHHDICSAQEAVALHMADLHEVENSRVQQIEELEVLVCVAELLLEPDVDPKFKKHAEYRFKNMFMRERSRWIPVAKKQQHLVDLPAVKKELRKLYQDKPTGRAEWKALLNDLDIPADKHADYR